MKKLRFYYCALACITIISCSNDHKNTDITLTDSDHYFSMNANFAKGKTRDVEEYMGRRIGAASSMSFTNTQSDATLTLDDRTTFYMKKYPGHLEIRLDKNKNSDEAFQKVKIMCEGIKKILVK